jgi:DNA-binding response OmpR family regulator
MDEITLNPVSTVTTVTQFPVDLTVMTGRQPILLSDDDPMILRLYEMMMARQGLITLSSRRGEESLAICQSRPISLVITDFMKPDVNGLELLKTLRRDPTTCQLPVMMVTASSHLIARSTFLDEGGNFFTGKPFDCSEMIQQTMGLLHQYFLHGLF